MTKTKTAAVTARATKKNNLNYNTPGDKGGYSQRSFFDLKIRLRNLSGYAAFLFLSYFILSATAVVIATSKR